MCFKSQRCVGISLPQAVHQSPKTVNTGLSAWFSSKLTLATNSCGRFQCDSALGCQVHKLCFLFPAASSYLHPS